MHFAGIQNWIRHNREEEDNEVVSSAGDNGVRIFGGGGGSEVANMKQKYLGGGGALVEGSPDFIKMDAVWMQFLYNGVVSSLREIMLISSVNTLTGSLFKFMVKITVAYCIGIDFY